MRSGKDGRGMRARDDDLVEGRARRSGAFATVAAMLALIALLPFVAARLAGDGASPAGRADAGVPPATGERSPPGQSLHGRLVFTTFEARGSLDRQQQLWVLDLATGALTEGPLVPAVEELWVADAERGWLVLVSAGADAQGVAYLLTALTTTAEPLELGRGDVVSMSSEGTELLVGRSEPIGQTSPGCEGHRYELERVSVASGARSTVAEGELSCGGMVAAVPRGEVPLVTLVDRGRPEVRAFGPEGEALLFRDLAAISSSPRGVVLFVDPEGEVPRGLGVWPRTPTGPLLVWPGSGSPRPFPDVRLYAQRVVAWSGSGGSVAIAGIVDDQRGLWLVSVPTGAMTPLLPPNSFPLRSAFSGAAFDDRGRAFAGAPGALVVSTEDGLAPLSLPPDAPSPVGPVAWLP